MLEGAVGHAASGQYYEITCEHLLLKVLESADGDAELLLTHFGQRRLAVAQRVQRALERMKTGNAGRPVFSESLFQWMEDAWVVASLNYGATQLRSGHLLLQFIDRPSRYTGEAFAELETISPPELRKQFEDILAGSPETPPAPAAGQAGGAPAGGGGGDAPTGEEALKRFTTSFTASAKAGKVDPIFGRHAEIRQLIDILARRRKNNPIIVGEPGVGKSALVEGLAIAIANGDVPDMLKDVDLLGLDLGALNAGASVKGEFEKRLKGVINEIKASPRNIVLFIDEAHTLVGGGGGAGGNDAANLLKPALARGELRTIAATTWSEYKKYFEKDAALERRFQPVKVDEPSEKVAAVMLRGLTPVYEKAHGVTIRDEAVVAAVALSHRYIAGRQLPDKAIDLLDTAAATVKIEQRTRPPELVALDEELSSAERTAVAQRRDIADGAAVDLEQHNELLTHIEAVRGKVGELTERWQAEKTAVEALVAARQALRAPAAGADEAALTAAVTAADEALRAIVGTGSPLIHTEVDPDAVARIVERWTGVPAGKMRASTIGAVLKLEDELAARVRGQDEAMKVVAETVRMAYAGVRDPGTPIGVLLFVGPSGVGKTETGARARRPALRRRAHRGHDQHVGVPGEAHRVAPGRLAAGLRRLRRGRHADRGGASAAVLGGPARRVREGRPRRHEPLLPGVRQGHPQRRRGPGDRLQEHGGDLDEQPGVGGDHGAVRPRRPAGGQRGGRRDPADPVEALQAGAARAHDDRAVPLDLLVDPQGHHAAQARQARAPVAGQPPARGRVRTGAGRRAGPPLHGSRQRGA
jgi:type VI secretion system protein VasG